MNPFSSVSIGWLVVQSLFWFAAVVGGAIVLRGHWLEYAAERDELKNSEVKRGKKWVMVGVVVEMVVALVFTIRDGREARLTAIEIKENNPMNQPIFDVSAKAFIRLKGPIFKELPVTNSDAPANFSSFGIPFDTNTLLSGNNRLYAARGIKPIMPPPTLCRAAIWISAVSTRTL